ncbi:hypothetical protein [Nitrosopumilus sp.]|uniref:hypothetical protein n=1 Tax=Nitrosopumilus sp. TaxID=2024843 RepID=UPI0034A07852
MSISQEPPRVYLDTNHWIRLLKISQGIEKNEKLEKIFEIIKELTKSDKIRVLYSAFTLNEIWKYHEIQEQHKLIDLILDVSQQWVLKPHNLFQKKEIENAATFVLKGKYIHNLNAEMVGKGLAAIFDTSFDHMNKKHLLAWTLLKNNPYGISEDFFRKDFQKHSEDLENTKQTLKDGRLQKLHKEIFEENKKLIENMEDLRQKNSTMNKDLFSRYSMARSLIDSVVPHLSVFMLSNQIKPEELFGKDPISKIAKEKINLLSKHLNSLNVMSVLVLSRDLTTQKKISPNDVYDIAHLSGAIPYCDVVVTDKMAARISRQKKLDEMYDCIILERLEELSQIEPIKSQI